jgi:hypothetical protein
MTRTLQGVIHGATIQLAEDLGLSEGQRVEVIVKTVDSAHRQSGEGFLRTEGALADDPDWDGIMEEIDQSR